MTRYFKIRGMDCAEEVAILKGEIGPLVSGEQNLTFDVLNARMGVTVPEDQVATAEIIKAVAGTGMTADVWREAKGDEPAVRFWSRNGQTILTVASGYLAYLVSRFKSKHPEALLPPLALLSRRGQLRHRFSRSCVSA